MAKKEIYLVAAAVVLVFVGAAVLIAIKNKSGNQTASPNPEAAAVGAVESSSKTMGAVPPGTQAPGRGEENLPAGAAVPQAVAPAAPGISANKRIFQVTVQSDAFTPDTVIIKQGDTMQIYFTAVDKNYDFKQPDMGLSRLLPKGKPTLIEGSPPSPGKYTFYCQSCGGPDKGPVGYIIVVSK